MLTLQRFASCIQCTIITAEPWHEPFLAAMTERLIDTPVRIAAFLAQVGHESRNLSEIRESMNYSAQRLTEVWPRRFPTLQSATHYAHNQAELANLVYSDRMGNGSFESGDGARYIGRGPIQITGATNYRRCGVALNLPLIERPELLLEPKNGARSAAWYWEDRGCNACADDVAAVTQLVNGGDTGLIDRRARFEHALLVLA